MRTSGVAGTGFSNITTVSAGGAQSSPVRSVELKWFVVVVASGPRLRSRNSFRLVSGRSPFWRRGFWVAALGRSARNRRARCAAGAPSSADCIDPVVQGLQCRVEVSVGWASLELVEGEQNRIEFGLMSEIDGVAGARVGGRDSARTLSDSGSGRSRR